jgi:fructokinase
MKQVLCYGEVLWDTFGTEKVAGGAPMNVALHLRQQGIDAAMISKIGNDAMGHKLVDFLKSKDLYIEDLIQTDEKLPTCEVGVSLDQNHQATYTIPQPVSWDNIQPTVSLKQHLADAQVVVFGSLACRNKTSRETLLNHLDRKTLKIFDVNLRAPHYQLETIETLAAIADVVKMNEEEALLLIGGSNKTLEESIIEFQKKFHSKTIIVTRGENGAIIWHEDKFYQHSGYRVDVADTVGAGDSFLATIVAGLLQSQPLQQVLQKACAVGAFVTSQRGANPTYSQQQLNQIVQQVQQMV